jgi:negative regulator of flagellin synthesis FlgM
VKIDSNSNTNLASLQDGLQRPAANDAKNADSAQQTETTSSAQSTVSLSALSSNLRSTGSADVDMAKVESIKSAIRDGSLKMDPSKIADGLLGTVRDLLQTKSPSTGG